MLTGVPPRAALESQCSAGSWVELAGCCVVSSTVITHTSLHSASLGEENRILLSVNNFLLRAAVVHREGPCV